MSRKKRIVCIGILVCLLIGAGIGGYYYFTHLYYTHDARIVRQLLNGLSASITKTDRKGFVISFREQYSAQAGSQAKPEEVTFAIAYSGEGSVSMSYALEADGTQNAPEADGTRNALDLALLMRRGNGYLSGSQREEYTYYDKSIRVINGEETEHIQDVAYALEHEFTVKIDGEDYYAASESTFRDQKDAANDMTRSFYGKIDKNILLNTLSEEDMAEATQKLFFMEAWTYVRQISDLSKAFFQTLDLDSPSEVSAFMKQNCIEVEEKGASVKVSFVLDTTRIFSEMSREDLGEMPALRGFLEIEKESGDILHFEYDLGELLLAILRKMNADRPGFQATVSEFLLEGQVLNSALEDKTLDKTFTEYNEENKAEFIYRFASQVIPFSGEE